MSKNIKLRNIYIDQMIKERLGQGLMKCLFDNDYIHVSHQEKPNGNIIFKAQLFPSRCPIDPRIFSICKSFDNIELVGCVSGTKQE